MPSRWLCIAILGFWLLTMGWMFTRDWLPWLVATNEAPPFVFELADEVVTQYATWTLYRNDKKSGSARTTLRYLRNNTFEWIQTLSNLEYQVEFAGFRVKALLPKVSTVMFVTPKGELDRFVTTAELKVNFSGTDFAAEMTLEGEVEDNQIKGKCKLKSLLGELDQPFGPSPIKSRSVFSPLQPVFRISGLYPGRSWKMNDFNPVSEAFRIAFEQLVQKAMQLKPGQEDLALSLPKGGSTELLALVLPETQELDLKDRVRKCYVIEYRSDTVVARTWVDVEDGTVLRQEALGSGEKLILQRD